MASAEAPFGARAHDGRGESGSRRRPDEPRDRPPEGATAHPFGRAPHLPANGPTRRATDRPTDGPPGRPRRDGGTRSSIRFVSRVCVGRSHGEPRDPRLSRGRPPAAVRAEDRPSLAGAPGGARAEGAQGAAERLEAAPSGDAERREASAPAVRGAEGERSAAEASDGAERLAEERPEAPDAGPGARSAAVLADAALDLRHASMGAEAAPGDVGGDLGAGGAPERRRGALGGPRNSGRAWRGPQADSGVEVLDAG